jgi:Eukaryotic-type carbonic anhydrase
MSSGNRRLSHAERKEKYNRVEQPIGENDRVTHDVSGRQVIVRKENFEAKGMMDEDAYFEELLSSYRSRSLQTTQVENYDDVLWWPYEWFLKVGTEYYFRYEGTQTVPPCYDTNHWRVYKDPIRVAPHQMRELERLIAWRLGGNCEVDTAGKPTGDENRVDVARPLQSYHKQHRMVFCECQDWPSKFTGDRQWCYNWRNKSPDDRLFDNPYNFPSDGFEFLQ